MEVKHDIAYTVTLTEQERNDLCWSIPEVLGALQQPVFGGYPWNWTSTDRALVALYNKIKPEHWGPLQ